MTNGNVDTLAPPAMASWLRETAANTRRHREAPYLTDKEMNLAPHVAFRLEQAAELIEQLARGEHICSVCYLRMLPPANNLDEPDIDPLF